MEEMKRVYERDEEGRRCCPPAFWEEEPMEISLTMPIDMTKADQFRKEIEKKYKTHITYNSLLIKAAAGTLEDFPIISGMWLSKDKIWAPNSDEIYIIYPVRVDDSILGGSIERANQKSLFEISNELKAQIDEIRKRGTDKLTDVPESFPPNRPFLDIVNLGPLGPVESVSAGRFSFLSIATAVLGACAVSEKPMARDNQIQIRKMMNLVLIFDHRAMHPNTPVKFLNELKRRLEEPATYL
jgi:pyruvate/2-oxoglutarate dehydrogenase complex dihydrolipoamide acyltransferase (E2) component